MSSATISSERTIRSTTLPVDASIRERGIVAVRASRLNQLTRRSRSIAAWADRLREVALAGPRWTDEDEVLGPSDPVEGAERPLGLAGDRRRLRVPCIERLAGREPSGLDPPPPRRRGL
jgi:hypothetical protein